MSRVQSVQRAFSLLTHIASEHLSLTELSEATDLPKSTVSRLLKTLEVEGAVRYDTSTHTYRIGSTISSLASGSSGSADLLTRSQPHLVVLAEATGEDAGLAVTDDDAVLYLAQAGAQNTVQVRDWTGERLPHHSVASGLAMLAHLPEDVRTSLLEGPLEQFTPATVTDPEAIRERLERVRSDGFVWCAGEYVEDLAAVAAPILDDHGRPVGAIHVHGPAYRFPPEGRREEIAAMVADRARLISDHLEPAR